VFGGLGIVLLLFVAGEAEEGGAERSEGMDGGGVEQDEELALAIILSFYVRRCQR